MNMIPLRAGVIGASGYTGREVARLVARHPRLRLAFQTSESEAGLPAPGGGRLISVQDVSLQEADVVFCCLPSGESTEWALRAASAGAMVVDLADGLRDGSEGAVYGLPELWREEIRGARLVANPGCYPTGALLALAPAIRAGILDPSRPVVIDAASGVTGAGRSPRRDLLFGELAEDFRVYGAGNTHRHVPEIARGLERVRGGAVPPFVFTPHLLPVRRGILETIYLPLSSPLTAADAAAIWGESYAGEPFVEVRGEAMPSLHDVVGRNVVALGFASVAIEPPMLLVVAALDNLLKGAAGQAVQNVNLMLGWDEQEGIPQ